MEDVPTSIAVQYLDISHMGYISTQHHDHARIKKNTPMEKYSIKLIAPSNMPEIYYLKNPNALQMKQ